MLKFVQDETELKMFFDRVLPPLTDKEVYFISLSARNKQLTEEERKLYDLGRTEMFERKIIREHDWMKFRRTIYKYEMPEEAITGRSGVSLPPKCLVLYINILPCDMVKAYRLFQTEMNTNVCNLLDGAGSAPDFFKRMDRLLMNAIQKSKGVRHYIDIDIDFRDMNMVIENINVLMSFLNMLRAEGIEYFVVNTKGGFHVLMKRDTIHSNYNSIVFEFQTKAATEDDYPIKEICRNNNDMIPLPGTLQGGFPVKVLYEISNYKNAGQ